MNLVELKSPKDISLDGVGVSFVTQDKNLMEISFTSGGKRFVVKRGDTYSSNIKIFRADDHTVERKHVLEGDVLGIKVCETFETSYDAERRKSELENKTDAKLVVQERDVKVDDVGNIVTGDLSEVPF